MNTNECMECGQMFEAEGLANFCPACACEDEVQWDNFTATMAVEGCWDMAGCEATEENFISAAQHLIDTGLAWSLQGYFGRTCKALIDAGHCTPA